MNEALFALNFMAGYGEPRTSPCNLQAANSMHQDCPHRPACPVQAAVESDLFDLVDETPGAALLAHGVPLLSQVRIWHRGYVAKGMLLADAELPDGYIVMCASMVKIFGRKDCALSNGLKNNPKSRDKTPETSAFEVIRTSNDSVRADGPSLEPARRLQPRCTSHPLSRGL